ncbi:MAG: transglycosylase SLT domain-containing protein [bacterium]
MGIVEATADPKNATVVNAIRSVAQQLGVDPTLALATAYHESGYNATAVGDHGTSFGIFQLHQGGEFGKLSPQQAYDPVTNARVALSVLANIRGIGTPGDMAAAAQRPANAGAYAKAVNSNYAALSGGTLPTVNTTPIPTPAGATPTLYGSGELPANSLGTDEGYLFQLTNPGPIPNLSMRNSTARKIVGASVLGLGGLVSIVALFRISGLKAPTLPGPVGAVQRLVPDPGDVAFRRAQRTSERRRRGLEGQSGSARSEGAAAADAAGEF